MAVTFYNVKTRSKVEVEMKDIKKKTFTSKNQTRYAFQTVVDGTNLIRFVNKQTYDEAKVPVEE